MEVLKEGLKRRSVESRTMGRCKEADAFKGHGRFKGNYGAVRESV